jgi:uncharacterized protein (DUF1778 family)
MEATRKEDRISARVTQDVHSTLRQAAEMVGATVNQFLVQTALKEAQSIIERERTIQLTQRDAKVFFRMLERPPKPKAKLRAAVAAYRKSGLNAKD